MKQPRMRSAVYKLCQLGGDALQPHKSPFNTTTWAKPIVSKRVANVIRKQALREGTYGSFDATTGKGWDVTWDAHVVSGSCFHPQFYHQSARSLNNNKTISTQLPRVHPPKLTARDRSRESRAKKVEALLEPADDLIDQYYQRKADAKPTNTGFEYQYKEVMRKATRAKKK